MYALSRGAAALVATSVAPRRWIILALAGVLPLALALAWWLAVDPLHVPMQPGFSVPVQEAWALSHPAAAAALVRAVFYWRHANAMIGVLGWLDAPVPPLLRLLEALALVALPFIAGGLAVPRWTRFTTLPAALGMALLAGVAMLLTWTVPGAAEVEGVQGRYFLPLCALALLAAPPWRGARALSRYAPALAAGAGLLGALAALYTLHHRYRRNNLLSAKHSGAELLGAPTICR